MLHAGLEYSTINTHRSSISAFHDPIEGFSVGKHPKVCNLMTGVFNKRPPKPKYCFVWDVETVLKYLKCLPPNDLLSKKMLTLKLTMLLALTSASRCLEIRNLDINYLTKYESKYCFNISKPTKTSKPGKPLPILEFERFESEPNICVVEALEAYIKLSKPWKEETQKTQLLLSYIKPHSPVKACTLSNWICEVPKYAGVDIKTFKYHSVRSASTSKAQCLGVSTKKNLKRGRWSSKSPWQKFYNKEIVSQGKSNFESILLL